VAAHARTVLVTGETGTGKELVAAALHRLGPRSSRRLVTVNCSAIAEPLFASQVFGHVRGAFTGAISQQKGLLDAANNGTLFLDEVGDMSQAIQAKLLRVLQEGDFIPVGDTKAKTVDIRFLAATNKDLEEEVRQKRFREDLYFRLNVISLHLPPLRERTEDIELLARHFLKKYAARMKRDITDFAPEALQLLVSYSWPGNIRELENAIERAAILTRGSVIRAETLPVWRSAPAAEPKRADRLVSLETVEREHILHVLKAAGNNKSRAARILDIARRTLDRKIEEFGLDDAGAP
jgi:transcriptional regulator with PAS, ATPase and Fis domain